MKEEEYNRTSTVQYTAIVWGTVQSHTVPYGSQPADEREGKEGKRRNPN